MKRQPLTEKQLSTVNMMIDLLVIPHSVIMKEFGIDRCYINNLIRRRTKPVNGYVSTIRTANWNDNTSGRNNLDNQEL
jgi:hypothetical protein